VSYLGYYEASSGKPSHAQAFGAWSSIRENVFPRTSLFLGSFVLTGIAAGLLALWSSGIWRFLYLLYFLLVLISVSQFLVGVLGGGGEPDLEKHLFMFNIAFDSCIVLAALGLMHLSQRLSRRLLRFNKPLFARGTNHRLVL
jgi:hypothetical protein